MRARIFLLASMFWLPSAQAVDAGNFHFIEAPLFVSDMRYITRVPGTKRIVAYENLDAYVANLRDGSKYELMTNQIRIFDLATSKLYSLSSDEMMQWGKIEYPAPATARIEVFEDGELQGHLFFNMDKVQLSYDPHALDVDSFRFNEAPFGPFDEDYITNAPGTEQIVAYETSGAFISKYRDGSEYGMMVNQIRIIAKANHKLYSLYSDDIEWVGCKGCQRGIEVQWGKIEYSDPVTARVEVVREDKLQGHVLINIAEVKLSYEPLAP